MKKTLDNKWKYAAILFALAAVLIIICVILSVSEYHKNRYRYFMNEGRIYMEKADYTKAIAAYRSAIKMNSKDEKAYLSLVEVYVRSGQYASAQSYAEQGYEITNVRRLEDLTDQLVSIREEGDTTDWEVFEWIQDEANGDNSITFCGKSLRTASNTDQGINESLVIEASPESNDDYIEETEETEVGTFKLGWLTYTYDVTYLNISSLTETLDLSPLADCKQLQELFIHDCWIQSLEPLSQCTNLQTLWLSNVNGLNADYSIDLSPLANCDMLFDLLISHCNVDSFEPLSQCQRLTELNLTGISDLTSFSGESQIESKR